MNVDSIDHADLAARREQNVRALLSNDLEVQRQPLISKYLVILEGEQQLRRAFKSPAPGAPAQSNALRKRLLARKHFVPWGSSKPFTPILPPASALLEQQQVLPRTVEAAVAASAEDTTLPAGVEQLVLWDPVEAGLAGAEADGEQAVVVDPILTRWLRPHQREGVQFMFDCVNGLRMPDGQGCILADDMGLGKTLQGITLMWTLLQQGSPALGGCPIARKAIIVCPTSLVSNWDSECSKWLKGRCRTLPLCESSRDDVIDSITRFTAAGSPYHCLIISYETFRLHAQRLTGPGSCDLLICDEAHRLKNDATLTNRALDSLPCRRRILLSGTPMQNHLDEFFAMVDFCNPGALGSPAEFRKRYEGPILAGREPGVAADVAALGEARSAELSRLVNQFILRRTNKLLSDHLPPKVVQVVVCRLTPLQRQLYEHFLLSNATRRLLAGSKATGVLSAITCLKKLCNHPKLIYDTLHSKAQADGAVAEGFEGVGELFPPGLFDNGRPGRGEMALGWEELSGKFALVASLLHVLRTTSNDKVVIVSNYTQSLDLFAVLCRQRSYPHVRLDGSTSITKRQKLVGQLNAPGSQIFVFLLSSKAGGCGLNLVGANRLILFDPDWNPAVDKQAAARVWRDGQKKRVYVYRLLSGGTIEEKVFQRQISKEGLQQVVDKSAAGGGGRSSSKEEAEDDGPSRRGGAGGPNMSLMSAEELRELFSLRPDVASDTYDVIREGSNRAAAAAAALAGGAEEESMCIEDSEAGSDSADDFDGEQQNISSVHPQAGSGTAAAAAGDDEPNVADTAAAAEAEPGPAQDMVDGYRPQIGNPSEEDLQNFSHHTAEGLQQLPDEALKAAAADHISFVFCCQVAGRLELCQQPQQQQQQSQQQQQQHHHHHHKRVAGPIGAAGLLGRLSSKAVGAGGLAAAVKSSKMQTGHLMVGCERGSEATAGSHLKQPEAQVRQLTGLMHEKHQQQQNMQLLVLARADNRLNCHPHTSTSGVSSPGGEQLLHRQLPQQVDTAALRIEPQKQSVQQQQQQQQQQSKQLTHKRQRISLKPNSSNVQQAAGCDASDDDFM